MNDVTSDTPRTDAHIEARLKWANLDKFESEIQKALAQPQSWPDFARQLERELNELRNELEEAKKETVEILDAIAQA